MPIQIEVSFGLVQVYEFTDAETGQTYVWNATEGRRIAEARKAEFVPVRLADFGMTPERVLQICPELDVKKALSLPGVALLSPILFVPHRGKHVLIDGHHRLYRAAVQGFPVLPAIILTEDEARAIQLEPPQQQQSEGSSQRADEKGGP
jgi:hypothetical protein